MIYTAQNTDPFDEHIFGKMRDYLIDRVDCTGCEDIVRDATNDDLLNFIEGDYPGGVAAFLAALEQGNGELP